MAKTDTCACWTHAPLSLTACAKKKASMQAFEQNDEHAVTVGLKGAGRCGHSRSETVQSAAHLCKADQHHPGGPVCMEAVCLVGVLGPAGVCFHGRCSRGCLDMVNHRAVAVLAEKLAPVQRNHPTGDHGVPFAPAMHGEAPASGKPHSTITRLSSYLRL